MKVPAKRTQNDFGKARRSSSNVELGVRAGVFMEKKNPAHLSAGRVRKSSVWEFGTQSVIGKGTPLGTRLPFIAKRTSPATETSQPERVGWVCGCS